MRPSILLLLSLGCAVVDEPVLENTPIEAYDPLDLVDPFIGTGGDGAQISSINPGASVPFGMTLVGPDTRGPWGNISFYHCAGYWYSDDLIQGISHTHAHGMGVPDYGTVAYMPRDGWRDDWTRQKTRAAPFTHDEEWARPGSYGVVLQDDHTRIDVAASLHGGHSRLTFAPDAEAVVVFDLGQHLDGIEVADAAVSFVPGESTLRGYQLTDGPYSGRFGGVQHWFTVELDPAPTGGGAWDDPDAPVPGATSASGGTSGIWLTFPEGTTEVDLRLALSSTSADGADRNFAAEMAEGSWEEHRDAAEAMWREQLGNVRVRGGTEDDRIIFHTALYHSALMPSRQDDVDGAYRGLDQELHTADHPYYSDFSLWDTFRTLHPFYILAWPEQQLDMVRSLVRMSNDGGSLPRWPLAHGYTGGMVGSPATQVIVESWLKGLTDFDTDTAWTKMLESAEGRPGEVGRAGIRRYVDEGFVGVEDAGGSVSRTLEFSWSDHALALWAEAHEEPEAAALRARSGHWRNVWHAETGFFTGRCAVPSNTLCVDDGVDDGFFWPGGHRPDFQWLSHYVEGNAWHYVWYVPYDVEGMIELQHGGDVDAFAERYQAYWEQGVYVEEDDLSSDDWYWHGNEPVMHAAFLGSLIGRPDLSTGPIRWVLANRYANDPVGLDGNDDSGTLSAWYLLASTGFFPVAGTTEYAVSSPLFERVEIDRPDGSTWVVRAPGASESQRYLQRLTIGGEEITSSVVTHDQLMSGEVVFELSDRPGSWPHAK